MRNTFYLLFCFISFFYANGQQIAFDSYFEISGGMDGYGRPRIVLTSQDNPLIIWRKDSSPKVLRASKWNGNSFSQPYDISQTGVFPSSWDGPEIAAKGDTVYVVFTSSSTSQSSIMLIRSFDGGLTFSDTVRVSPNDPIHKYRMANVEVNSDGDPIVSYMQYLLNWSEPKQMVSISNNQGSSFLGPVEASALAPGEPCDCCKSSLVSSGDDLFLLFRNNNNNERNSFIAKSVDGGLSFIATNDLDDYDWILNSCPATTPRGVVLRDSIIIVKRSGATGNNEIVCSSVSMINLNYLYNNNIDDVIGVQQDFPEVAASNDTVIVVWQDNRNGLQNCFMSFSVNGAYFLNSSISFTDSTSVGYKSDPDVEFSNGDIHLVYLDNTAYKIFYTKASFESPNLISDQSETSDIISRIIDFSGREISGVKNQPLFHIYNDGKVKKMIILE